jgi:hypothetical protein
MGPPLDDGLGRPQRSSSALNLRAVSAGRWTKRFAGGDYHVDRDTHRSIGIVYRGEPECVFALCAYLHEPVGT